MMLKKFDEIITTTQLIPTIESKEDIWKFSSHSTSRRIMTK